MAADPSILTLLRSTSALLLDLPSSSPEDDLCCSPLSFRLPSEETLTSPNSCHGYGVLPDSADVSSSSAADPESSAAAAMDIDGEPTLEHGHRFSFSFEGLISDAADMIESCSTAQQQQQQAAAEGSWRDEEGGDDDDNFEFSRGGGGDVELIQSAAAGCGHAGLLPLNCCCCCCCCTSSSAMNIVFADGGADEPLVSADGHGHGHQRAVSLDLPPANGGHRRHHHRKLTEHPLSGIHVADDVRTAADAAAAGSTSSTSADSGGSTLMKGMAASSWRSNSGTCRKYATKLAELLSPAAHLSLQPARIRRRRGRSSSSSSSSSWCSFSAATSDSAAAAEPAVMKSSLQMEEEAPHQKKEKAASMASSSPNASMSSTLPPKSLWNHLLFPFTGRSRSNGNSRMPPDDGDGESRRRSTIPAASANRSFQSLPPRTCSARRNECDDVGDAVVLRSRNIVISAAPSTVSTTTTAAAAAAAQSFQFLPWPARSCSPSRKPDDDGVGGEGIWRRRSGSARTPAAAAGYIRSPSSLPHATLPLSSIDGHRPKHRSKASPWTPGHIHTNAYETPPWDGLRRRPKETVFRTHSGHNKILYPIATSPTLNLALYRGTSSKRFKLRNLFLCTNNGKEKLTSAMVKC